MTTVLGETLDAILPQHLSAPAWVVGLSGGVDSTVLLHLLSEWKRTSPDGPPLSALHVDHGLAENSGDWQAHCQQVCDRWQVPLKCHTVTVEPGASLESSARKARYAAFESALPLGSVLFLAHHLDDQVETFFLRLLRGAGVEGLAGIPASRGLGEAALVRPLLGHTRAEIVAYAQAQGLPSIEDPSNFDTDMDRNFLRREVLPLLESRWLGYRHTVARATGHLERAGEMLRDHIGVPETVFSVLGDPGVAVTSLSGEHGGDALRYWLQVQGCQVPTAAKLEEFLRQLREGRGDSAAELVTRGYTLARYGDAVYRLPDATPPDRAHRVIRPGEQQQIVDVGTVALVPSDTGGWRLEDAEALSLRWREGGERVRQPGREGSSDLKAIFQTLRVPPWWRDHVPLLYAGDELLAVADLVVCDSARWQAQPTAGETLWNLVWRREF